MDIKDTIDSILAGSSLDDELAALIHEKRVCRNVGPRQKRKTKTGRIYWQRERVCRGIPDPSRSRSVKRSLVGKSQKRSRSQQIRWRNVGKAKKMVRRKQRRKSDRRRK